MSVSLFTEQDLTDVQDPIKSYPFTIDGSSHHLKPLLLCVVNSYQMSGCSIKELEMMASKIQNAIKDAETRESELPFN